MIFYVVKSAQDLIGNKTLVSFIVPLLINLIMYFFAILFYDKARIVLHIYKLIGIVIMLKISNSIIKLASTRMITQPSLFSSFFTISTPFTVRNSQHVC